MAYTITQEARRRVLLMQRYKIDLVIDVGANQGQFVELLSLGYPHRIVSFEPLCDAFAILQQTAATDTKCACLL